ncbi:DUF883 family protein [Neisseria shayeganii]|uniref:DUF883 domain-containing protein n=1 Tax=Neisseria shayeganii TaxID=607712 RepID=A0A7D7NDZ8_9NEIS|nr:DUF883 family protein [Neisseria shayeganii]QMT39534.1 DUF883 domain-containing protein [Neisseria shayeganii]
MSKYERQKEDLMKEVRSVLGELESLYETAKDDGSQEARALKEKVQSSLGRAKNQLLNLESQATERVKETARQTDALIHEQPYYAMGIAALAGVVIGALLTRR